MKINYLWKTHQKLESIYDTLGIILPTTLIRKIIYRDVCNCKLSWDDELPDWIVRRWKKLETKLPTKVKVPRTIRLSKESLNLIDIHMFGDDSLLRTSAVAYAIIQQPSGIKQGSIASKSRLSIKQMVIPRLELVGAKKVANLAESIRASLPNCNIREFHGLSDSTVVLHCLQGNGSYKQFIHNRVSYINLKSEIN